MASEESAPSTSVVDPEAQEEDPTVVTGESRGDDESGESAEISKIVEDQTAQEADKSSDAAEITPIVEAHTVQEEDKSEAEVTEEEVTVDAEPEKDGEDSTGEEESETPRKLTVDDIKTAPMDFRFPTTNQAKHCFTRYVEYHRCVQVKGEGNTDCDKYARYYRSLCPNEWVERWNEQRENGTFAGPL